MYIEHIQKNADAYFPRAVPDGDNFAVGRRNEYIAGWNLPVGIAKKPEAKQG
jgi:hypothetical protein